VKFYCLVITVNIDVVVIVVVKDVIYCVLKRLMLFLNEIFRPLNLKKVQLKSNINFFSIKIK